MSVKTAMMMLLVAAAALSANAGPGPEDCDGLNVTLHTKDLHKVFGDWVLVWSVADHQSGWDLLPNVSSSHVELRLHHDNHTVMLTERNMYMDKTCTNYYINMSMPADPSVSHSLHSISATVEQDGVHSVFNESGHVDFFETCDDCLSMIFNLKDGRFLLNYRREGQHQDVEKMTEAHSDHKKMAECLGFPHDKPYSYDGAADFCHKKSSPEAEATVKPE